MTTLATLYPDAPRDCIEALYQANPDLTARLLSEFPEATFSWLEPPVEVEPTQATKPARKAETEPSTTDVGRLF